MASFSQEELNKALYKREEASLLTHVHTERENAGKVSEYKGEFEDGMFHGTGMNKDVSGCVYEGDFYRGAAHIIGKCHWAETRLAIRRTVGQ
jgi:hypothetical protein